MEWKSVFWLDTFCFVFFDKRETIWYLRCSVSLGSSRLLRAAFSTATHLLWLGLKMTGFHTCKHVFCQRGGCQVLCSSRPWDVGKWDITGRLFLCWEVKETEGWAVFITEGFKVPTHSTFLNMHSCINLCSCVLVKRHLLHLDKYCPNTQVCISQRMVTILWSILSTPISQMMHRLVTYVN